MTVKGLSILIVDMYDYSGTGNKLAYGEPTTVTKTVEYSLAINQSEDNPLYVDDVNAEHDKGTFRSDKLSLTAGDLTQEASRKVLGIRTEEFTYNTDKDATEGIYDDKRMAPYSGIDVIKAHRNNDVTKYRAVFLSKVFFNVPEQTAATEGEPIERQTSTITGTVTRGDLVDDKCEHPWMMGTWFQTRAEATLYSEYKYGKTDA